MLADKRTAEQSARHSDIGRAQLPKLSFELLRDDSRMVRAAFSKELAGRDAIDPAAARMAGEGLMEERDKQIVCSLLSIADKLSRRAYCPDLMPGILLHLKSEDPAIRKLAGTAAASSIAAGGPHGNVVFAVARLQDMQGRPEAFLGMMERLSPEKIESMGRWFEKFVEEISACSQADLRESFEVLESEPTLDEATLERLLVLTEVTGFPKVRPRVAETLCRFSSGMNEREKGLLAPWLAANLLADPPDEGNKREAKRHTRCLQYSLLSLGDCGTAARSIAPLAERYASSRDADFEIQAIRAVGAMDTSRIAAHLGRLSELSKDPERRDVAIFTVGKMLELSCERSAPGLCRVLESAFEEHGSESKKLCLDALGRLREGQPATFPLLAKAIAGEHPEDIKLAACSLLHEHAPEFPEDLKLKAISLARYAAGDPTPSIAAAGKMLLEDLCG